MNVHITNASPIPGFLAASLIGGGIGARVDRFVIDLDLLLTGKWPIADATAARDADAHLNASYRKTLAWAASGDNMSTIHSEAIRKAQRAWLVYRDAFVRFAAAASPRTSRDAVIARLTNSRNTQLDQMPV